ncbi:Rossman fold protein, TIGR00730 family [Candidatus Uhrbacteria bacterium RIFOXYB2_FULL_45_11]|uniref:Cytokinin riboside 5'-monophosphate phosphoribohydrolase n=1 Tax=Candidatus Uhrbacteria bacterium RIFOXYB2_FULL_45_11 TaxID=1802421 RepID=A0A1F7W2H8_9BACT|nr:MAG: Rossman fold protein, TIGR00730 family [Candidatus Uhrbacteria bacterium RIFOXYB2_FULL_45_11]
MRLPLSAQEVCNTTKPTSIHDMSWRIFRIMAEFVEGFQVLSETSKEVTFWGGTQIQPDSHWYKVAEELGEKLANDGFTIITGGGPGIMEAGNKGAAKAGGVSVGFNILLPKEQHLNAYVNKGHSFHYFFSRKVVMAASAQAYVFFPGGFGTMDEFFEIVTLIETGKMQKTPVVCVGKEFWNGLFEWLRTVQRDQFHTIHNADLNLIQLVDTVEEAFQIVSRSEERSIF